MKILETGIPGLIELSPTLHSDSRGYFFESYRQDTLLELTGGVPFVQDNQSFSRKGVLRGLHYQNPPHAQAKLVRVLTGKALDVVVDLRPQSPTFGKVHQVVLDAALHNMLLVPEGFAHGFLALDDCLFFYKCSQYYHRESEGGIRWNDPFLAIDWGNELIPLVSEKDQKLPYFDKNLFTA
jgi:dTDP-4-dehydrorhamnose 3,5-epimerase